jgi:hypothetical protein
MRKYAILRRRVSMSLAVVALSCTLTPVVSAAEDALQVYSVPKGLLYSAHNDDFTVRVRKPGGPWQDLYEYRVQVDTDTRQKASMVYFDFQGTVEIEVQKNNGRFDTVSVC